MDFSKGILATLLHHGLLEDTDWDTASKKRMQFLLALRQEDRQTRKDKYQEHRRNGVWEEHVAKCFHKDEDCFVLEKNAAKHPCLVCSKDVRCSRV